MESLESLLASPIEKFDMGIGECVFTNAPMLIRTVLGSCVSVTFFHAASRFAGAFHAVMPEADLRGGMKFCKFVDTAIAGVIYRFVERNIALEELAVKLFGGANQFANNRKGDSRQAFDTGRRNVLTALSHLRDYGLRVRARDVQGQVGRSLYFSTASGEVWVRRHAPSAPPSRTPCGTSGSFHSFPLKKGECRYVDVR